MIEMRLLEILSAFAEEGTQAAAAEKLHISQPTLSSSMRKLEEEIGAPLFERTKNRMMLNENGQAAADFAGRILREEAAMRQHIQEMERRKHTVSFALCSHSPVAKMTMIASQAFPDMQLNTVFCTETEEMVQGLTDHLYTFILTESPVLDERAYGFPCYTERLVALIPEDQPEAKRKSVSLDELKGHQMLFFCNGGAWERYIRRKLKEGEFIPQTNFADYGTNRVANYLNERGIKTKRGTTLWRATSVRALIDNRIYLGYMRMGDTYSPKQEHLQIIDEATWEKCQETVKGRATCLKHEMKVPERTDTRSLLSGLIFCADCGSRLTFSHNTTRRKLADGTVKLYERDCYRCYRKINARESCSGQSSYCADTINETVLYEIRRILSIIKQKPEAALLEKAKENHGDVYEVAYKQAEKDFFEAHKQMNALEDQTMKFLTGENTVDISIVNAMMPKYKEKLETAQRRMEEAKAKMEKEKDAAQTATQEVTDLLSWADTFDEANAETKHMIIARLVERIEINHDYEVEIKFRISVEQYMRIAA